MKLFETVKQSVTARQAAKAYGQEVDVHGMALCPFHDDHHPSLKLDQRFYCFGCGASGDVIDFAATSFISLHRRSTRFMTGPMKGSFLRKSGSRRRRSARIPAVHGKRCITQSGSICYPVCFVARFAEYVLEHTGLKVSNLYISQIKRKCGIEVGKNYNLPKSEDSRQPQCPLEKEKAIREAFKYFGMI